MVTIQTLTNAEVDPRVLGSFPVTLPISELVRWSSELDVTPR